VFKPHIDALLTALLDCFKDESWPVRDAACVACGFFVATFPEESQPMFDELSTIWFAHLSDNIFSVRHHSALALATIYKKAPMYQDTLMERFTAHIQENIMKAKTDQQNVSKQFSALKEATTFGVAQPFDENHDNKQMYSCGSLAPKLKRGGGCMDHGFARECEPWECSDGCIYLLRELSLTGTNTEEFVIKNLQNLADIAYVDHFKHAQNLKENLFKSLKEMISSP